MISGLPLGDPPEGNPEGKRSYRADLGDDMCNSR